MPYKKATYLFLTFFVLIGFAFVTFKYCQRNYPFWNYLQTDEFKALCEYKGKRIKGLRGQQILVHKNFYHQLERCCK